MKTLQECNWNIFAFTELFEIRDGYYNKKPPFEPNGKIPFLGATQNDNGITGFYTLPTIQKYDKVGTTIMNDKEKRIFKGNCIAITNNGSVGNAYYQIVDFTCSHDITPIYLKTHTLSRYIAMFLIPMIMKRESLLSMPRNGDQNVCATLNYYYLSPPTTPRTGNSWKTTCEQ